LKRGSRAADIDPVPAMTEGEAKALLNAICQHMHIRPERRTPRTILTQLGVELEYLARI
jgi:hypothetical protein